MSAWLPPLGCPGRFSLTPVQQAFYRALVARAVRSGSAMVYVGEAVKATGKSKSNICNLLGDLIERGFVERHGHGIYALSEPVMDFKAIPAERRAA